jgi:hypothetical protein
MISFQANTARMVTMKLKTLITLSALLYANIAHSIECVELKKNNSIEFELKSSNKYENCFSLIELPSNMPIQLMLFSDQKIRSITTLFNITEAGGISHIADYNSDIEGISVIQTNTANRKLGFKITPKTNITTNKDVHLTYVHLPEGVQIIAQLFDVKQKSTTTPRPPESGCIVKEGRTVCYAEK